MTRDKNVYPQNFLYWHNIRIAEKRTKQRELDKELIKDTNIYYCNGKNRTEFEYFCNESSAPFCLYYTDGYCAIKLYIVNKQFNIYLYNHRNILIPFNTLEINTNIHLKKIYKYLDKKYDKKKII